MFKSIVVDFDGSQHANRALEIGTSLAGQAPLSLLDTMGRTSSDSEKALLEYGDFLVTQAADCARRAGVERVEYKAALGDVAEEIVTFATKRKADLIVCGSRGFGKLKGLLLGSTSSKLVKLAECSCLTVK